MILARSSTVADSVLFSLIDEVLKAIERSYFSQKKAIKSTKAKKEN